MNHSRNNNVLVIVGAVVFCFVIAACVAVFVAAPEGANTGSLITLLVGQLAPTLVALGVLAKVNAVDTRVTQVADDTYRLTNGLLDSKTRAAVADVVHPDMINPDAHEQLATDRLIRGEQHLPEQKRDTENDMEP